MADRRPFRPRDLLREVQIQEVAVSPDGEWVVYARRTIEDGSYRKRLWRVPWRGGRPEQLTHGDVDARPRFSPDGSALLFLSRRSGKSRAWLLPLAGGDPRELAAPDGEVADARWSPDGGRVLLLAASGEPRFSVGDPADPVARRIDRLTWRLDGVGIRDECTSIWVTDTNGRKPKRLTAADVDVMGAEWSPDGRRIGFVADLRPEAAVLEAPQGWSVPAAGGEPKALAELPGEVFALAWSRSGRLAIHGLEQPAEALAAWENQNLYVVDGDAPPRRLAPELDRSVGFLVAGDLLDLGARTPELLWLDDDSLLGVVCDRGESHVHRFDVDGGDERLTSGAVVCTHLATGGGRIVTVAAERGRPGEVCAVEGGALRRLTRDGSRWLARARIDPEPVGGDGVDAWLVRAPRKRRPPLVLQIHGGPHLAHGPTPWLEMLALAHAGFSVLYANPRGSAGYGQEFTRGIEHDWGTNDAADLMRVLDRALAEGLGDPDRVGVLGLSYGGFMTNWLLGHHPGRFAAGVSENPVTELASFSGTGDFGSVIAEIVAGVSGIGTDRARLADRSPATAIHRNEAPLLLLQAENDLRCPPDQTEIVFAELRKLGRTVEMVRYPNESHLLLVIGRPDRRVDRLERIVGWFERHL